MQCESASRGEGSKLSAVNYNYKHDSTIYYYMHACVITGKDCNNRQGKLPLLVKTFETLHKDSEVSDRVTCTHKDYKNNVFDRGLQNSDGPSQWYIHPSGIDRHSSYWLSHYQTAKCGDKISYYELDSDVQVRSTMLLYFVCMCEVVYTHVYMRCRLKS